MNRASRFSAVQSMSNKLKKLRIFTEQRSADCANHRGWGWCSALSDRHRRSSSISADISSGRSRNAVAAGSVAAGLVTTRLQPSTARAQPRWNGRQTLPPVREDFSKAPAAEKRDTVPERHVLVLGDAMADWLAYGLEDAYAEQPDMGVIRKTQDRLRPDQISAEGRSGRLGRRCQRHSRHRKSGRHCRHARTR